MANIVDGGGVYRQDAILGPFDEDRGELEEVVVPQIEEIRAIRGEDGEIYYNAKDLVIAMNQVAMNMPLPTLSVLRFIRMIIIELITARR